MSKSKSKGISRRNFIGVSIGSAVVAGIGCSSSSPNNGVGGGANDLTGGGPGAGGGAGTGGSPESGGNPATGGASSGTAANQTGGATGAGGAPASGGAGAGGAATGGKPATGGATGAGGKTATGGATGAGAGGKSAATGGAGTAGAGVGGSSAASGGAATGGATSTGGSALVSLVRGTDWVQATMDAIALAGGLPDLTGKTVMLRPNVIENTTDATTSPEVIHGVIKAAKAKGATTIVVAEDGWNASGGGGTLGCMQKLGIQAVCDAEGATTMDLAAEPRSPHGGVNFSDPVFDADYVIAIPKCKSHSSVGKFTMSLKLWYGNTDRNSRSHSDASQPAKLHAIKKADFSVIDATACMITGGPSAGGTMVQSKLVVASKDAIAADATGLLILKYSGSSLVANWSEVWSNVQIKGALAQKIPGWLSAAPAQSQQAFPYAAQGVTEAGTIMGY